MKIVLKQLNTHTHTSDRRLKTIETLIFNLSTKHRGSAVFRVHIQYSFALIVGELTKRGKGPVLVEENTQMFEGKQVKDGEMY